MMLGTKFSELSGFIRANSTNNVGHLEIEAKFGKYARTARNTQGNFQSYVHYLQFERLRAILLKLSGVTQRIELSQVAQMDKIRRITTMATRIVTCGDTSNACENKVAQQESAQETVIYQEKTRLQDFDILEYGIRITGSHEITVPVPLSFTPTTIRDRTRYIFQLSAEVRVDMTEVMQCDNNNTRSTYEVEVEFLGKSEELADFQFQIERIYKWLYATHLLYTVTMREQVTTDIANIIGIDNDGTIDKSVLVQARNIKRRDLVYGGIVGSVIEGKPVNYYVTFKADGLRKMLIVHTTGIWLVYPPYDFNLIIDAAMLSDGQKRFINALKGTVFDGELVTPKTGDANSYWYFAFDCLALGTEKQRIQNLSYSERKKRLSTAVEVIKRIAEGQKLNIDLKESVELTSPENFFSTVEDFLRRRSALIYKDDGLIFTPNTIYNPHSDSKRLRERVLSKLPDVCKWKETVDLTIDFIIRWVASCKLELLVYDDATKQVVPFRGDIINPITEDMIDHENPLTLGKPSGIVVEYEWKNNKLRPRLLRPEKNSANKLEIALDIWEDIRHPIDKDTLLGNNLKSSFASQNRIKGELYRLLPRNASILDIGSGRGGDVPKWKGLYKIVAVEPNAENRTELISRVATFAMTENVKIVASGGEDTVAITRAVREFIPGGQVDAVTIMLSMSFFWSSKAHIDALVRTIAINLKAGGQIIFLTIDGDVVEQMFNNTQGPDIDILEAHMHLYEKPRDEQFGRPLLFVLRGTIVEEQIEYLVHLQDFSERLLSYGIELQSRKSADKEPLLSQANKRYSAMYTYGNYKSVRVGQNNNLSLENIILPIVPAVIEMENAFAHMKIASPPRSPKSPRSSRSPRVSVNLAVLNDVVQPVIKPEIILIPPTCPPLIKHKIRTQQNFLPSLLVSSDATDDTYAVITCTWYQDLIRIATIGDGNCFIHALLKAFYPPYQNNNDQVFRRNLATKFRTDLGLLLSADNRDYPGYNYWSTSGKGGFPRLLMQELMDETLLSVLGVDFSLRGLQYLFNSKTFLGDETYQYVSDLLDMDIYVLRITSEDIYPHLHTRNANRPRYGIVILGDTSHYEVLAINNMQEGFRTVFAPSHPLIKALVEKFKEDNDCNILATVPYNPDETFVRDARDAFQGKIPDNIERIFPDATDPFRVALDRLREFIVQQ